MQKLRYSIINRILDENLTGTQIDILLYISRFQDDSGRIFGVYYKDIAIATFRHKTQIYKALSALESKGFISREKNSRYDMDITILNNDFSDKDFSGGYLSVDKKIFLNGEFFRMKAREKIITLQLIKNCDSAPKGTFRKKREEFIKWYGEKLGVISRSVGAYLTTLKKYFNIYLKNGIYYIKCLKGKIEGTKQENFDIMAPTDRDQLYRHEVNKSLRRSRAACDPEDKKELGKILQQYADEWNLIPLDLTPILRRCLELADNMERKVNIKLVHKLVRDTLGITEHLTEA